MDRCVSVRLQLNQPSLDPYERYDTCLRFNNCVMYGKRCFKIYSRLGMDSVKKNLQTEALSIYVIQLVRVKCTA